MKNSISKTAIVIALLFVAQLSTGCASKSEQATESHGHAKPDSTAVAYVCPMHPDVTGKDGDTCSKCGMKLEASKNPDSIGASGDSTEHSHE